MALFDFEVASTKVPGLLRWMGRILVVMCFAFLPFLNRLFAQESVAREYQIKAVFLYNFTQFVQWPEEAFSDTASPLVIGVLGKDPFGSFLDETVKGEVVNNHQITIERYGTVEEVKNCHVLFIVDANDGEIRRALEHLKKLPVLTVSDTDGFVRMGGMIRLFNDGGRIRLRVNVDAATEANLVISSKLLRLADIRTQKNN